MEKHEQGIKRFGVRYGRTVKAKLGKVEAQHRGSQQCPYCHYEKVRRKSAGIWHCSKCATTFASRAYQVSLPPPVKSEATAFQHTRASYTLTRKKENLVLTLNAQDAIALKASITSISRIIAIHEKAARFR